MTKTIESLENFERLEAFEEQFGIRLEGLSISRAAGYKDYCVYVNGDIFAANGITIDRDIHLVISYHDATDKVLVSEKHSIKAISFSGLDTFSVLMCYKLLPFVTVKKVRIYPQLSS